ncbi:MAG: hypothetical protein HOK54_06015 [Alphaproteobacteria bacterium]|jgi:hypothetical protein|nr:hypothetical protein [Alphaproteobacteria bacterium]
MFNRIFTGFDVLVFLAAFSGMIVLSSSYASAQGKDPYRAVSSKDNNGDGKVSLEEWPRSKAIFKRIDKDKDGFLSPEDFAKHWGIPLRERSETASGGGKKKKKRGGDQKAQGDKSRVAEQTCTFEDVNEL